MLRIASDVGGTFTDLAYFEIDEKSGKIFYEAGFEIDEDFINFINERKLKNLNILKIDNSIDTSEIHSNKNLSINNNNYCFKKIIMLFLCIIG